MTALFRNKIKKGLPGPVLGPLRKFRFLLRKISSFGRGHYCPVCHSHVRKWRPVTYGAAANLQCPVCFSLERHRLDWLFLSQRTNLLDTTPKRFFHVAPESFIIPNFRKVDSIQYITGDLKRYSAMIQLDLTAIPFRAGFFDTIYCSHVLEHIQDDRKALAELFRISKPGGWAVLQVPITVEKTLEDPTILDPAERERVFGQHDHVRRCGLDYVDRMRAVGFNSKIFPAGEIITAQDSSCLGIQLARMVIYCEKACE